MRTMEHHYHHLLWQHRKSLQRPQHHLCLPTSQQCSEAMHRNLLACSNSIKNVFTGNIFWPSTIGQAVYLETRCVNKQERLPGLFFFSAEFTT